jgi:hypothetical protein
MDFIMAFMTQAAAQKVPLGLLLLAQLLFTAPVYAAGSAASPDEAKALYSEGSAQYALGHFREALVVFEKLYLSTQLPALLFNIAQCHRQLRDFEHAAITFRSFIRLAPESSQAADAKVLLAQVEEALRAQASAQTRPPLGQIAQEVPAAGVEKTPPDNARPLPGVPSEAQASENQKPSRTSSGSSALPLSPGPARPDLAQDVATAPRKATPAADEAALKSAASSAKPATGRAAAAPLAAVQAQPGPAPRGQRAIWVAGAGAVVLGAGGVFGLLSKSTISDLTGAPHSRDSIASLQGQLDRQAAAANVLFAVGGVLLAAGGALYALRF